jgi:primosomal protein N' (replication factor Y)
VPEADPLPATAAAVLEGFGELVGLFLGGDKRARYRVWLDILGGRYRVVVGTRPAMFSPVRDLGLIWISRESHPGHREERSPYYHVRDVALARAGIERSVCVCEALCPSAEAAALEDAVPVIPAVRSWRKVEVVAPGPEGRAPRLVQALRSARTAFLYQPLRGYGVARVCRSCHEPAACVACGGLLRQEGGRVRCTVCEADGRCRNCGASDFGVVRGGEERVREWASALNPGASITVGGPEAVKDVGSPGLDLVAILDADLASRRPGLASKERALAVWMEAAALARSDGRVILQTRLTNDPAVQALVTGNPERFHRAELPRRAAAGFPVGFPVFRVAGTASLEQDLEQLRPASLLSTGFADERICLVTVRPADVGTFGTALRRLAERGTVTRVEAEPHL